MSGYMLFASVAFSAASICFCLGFILGGVLSSSKLNDLSARLARTEGHLEAQSAVIRQLTKALRDILVAAGSRQISAVQSLELDTTTVQDLLAQCDDLTRESAM